MSHRPPHNRPPLFTFEQVFAGPPDAPILAGIDLILPDDVITVLAGPSGSGKTTLLRLCNRLDVPTAGSVRFRGRPLDEIDPLHLRRTVGMVFQRPVLLGGTVRDNLRLAAPDAGDRRLAEVLERTELDAAFLERDAATLSGGEGQRMCLARTLLTDPEVLLMDEPTASVDPAIRGRLESLARSIASNGVPMLWVTHDLDQARRLADHVVVLSAGVVRFQGDAAELGTRRGLQALALLTGGAVGEP